MIPKDNFNCLVFVVIAQFSIALAFHTLHCDQNQLEVKTMGTLKCLNDHFKEFEGLFQPNQVLSTFQNGPIDCDFIDRDIACFADHIGACFADEFKTDMATMIEAAYLFEAGKFVSCNRHSVKRKSQFMMKVYQIPPKYQQYQLKIPIELDQICDKQTSIESFNQHDKQCKEDNADPNFNKALFNAFYSRNKTAMPVCKGVTESLKCFSMKGCLTDQEREFLENLAATFYKFVMNEIVRIQDDFGSFSSLINLIGGSLCQTS